MNTEGVKGQVSVSSQFQQIGYVVLSHLLSEDSITRLDAYMLRRVKSGAAHSGDIQVPDTPAMYGDPVLDKLLEDLAPKVEEAVSMQVFPTYSYMRLYKEGDILAKHTDREACEISLSVCIATDPPEPWPLWIQAPQGTAKIELTPGEAVLYRGIDCMHWRDRFPGKMAKQVFLHYVAQNGRYREWRFDKRANLAHKLVQSVAS